MDAEPWVHGDPVDNLGSGHVVSEEGDEEGTDA